MELPPHTAQAGEVHAWEVDPTTLPESKLLHSCYSWLNDHERGRWNQLARSSLRHEFLVSNVLRRITLSRYAEVPPSQWQFTSDGKPAILSPSEFGWLHFNVTHTDGLTICAVARQEVGIDAEDTTRNVEAESIARDFFSADDCKELVNLPARERTRRFFEIWTLKEAYLKATGVGLMRDLNSFTLPRPPIGQHSLYDGWDVSLHQRTEKHLIAVAAKSDGQHTAIRWHAADFAPWIGAH